MNTDLTNLREKYKSPDLPASFIATANWGPESVTDLTPEETEWLIYHLQRREMFDKYNAADEKTIREVSKVMEMISPVGDRTEMMTMICKCVAIDKLSDRPDMRFINSAQLEDTMWSRYAETGEGGSEGAMQRPAPTPEVIADPEPEKPKVPVEELEAANEMWRNAIKDRAKAKAEWSAYIETINAQKRDALLRWDEYVEMRRRQYAQLRSQ